MKHYFLNSDLVNRQVTVVLAGCGGTGSQILSGLARMDVALRALGHPGLDVVVFDGDSVSEANVGRQLFSPSDIGRNKADVLCTRVNTFFGLGFISMPYYLSSQNLPAIRAASDSSLWRSLFDYRGPDLTISAVDSARARIEINRFKSVYSLDCGNMKSSGQVILGTQRKVGQPTEKSDKKGRRKQMEGTIEFLPTVLDLYPDIEKQDKKFYQGPSCSVEAALRKQDLLVNQWVATAALQILWKALRQGYVEEHGAFLNLETMSMRPLPVDPETWVRIGGKHLAKKKQYAKYLSARRGR